MPRILLAAMLGAAAALPAGSAGLAGEAGRVHETLAQEAGLRAAFETSRHAARAVAGGWLARNTGQAWQTRFDGRGFTVEPDAGDWRWGLALVRYGFAGAERAVGEPLRTRAYGARVAYERDETLEEWWINDARGLEHGFTVRQRPWEGREEPGPLTLTLAVRGELCPEVGEEGRSVTFADASGAAVLTYTSLSVLDADGRPLAAGFERVSDGLLLTIDERGARYPLTIDPVAQQAYLKASNTDSADHFGWSVAISGDTAVIGAPGEDSSATGVDGDQANNGASSSGAAYVFEHDGTSWSQQAYLKASNTDAGDQFGFSVSIAGDTLVVGAPLEDSTATGVGGDPASNGANSSGAAYVFVRNGASWSQQAYLKASNTEAFDQFGQAVSASGDSVVVGGSGEDSTAMGVNGDQTNNGAPGSGAAYVFVRTGTSWVQQAYLKASNTASGDLFGTALSLAGDTLVVGAIEEDSAASGVNGDQSSDAAFNSGAAYVFVRSAGSWSQEAYLKASNTEVFDAFGTAAACWGDTVVVGAPSEDSVAAVSGAAYVFVRAQGAWSQQAYLKASNAGSFDSFASSLSIQRNSLVVGARNEASATTGVYGDETSNASAFAGAAYLFERNGVGWSQQAYIKASNTDSNDRFGFAVALSDGLLVVGAFGESSSSTGVNGDQASNAFTEAGATYAFQLCPQARVLFRTAGSNPASYVASPAVLGSTFTATVDNNLAGQTSSLLFAFDTPTSFPLPGGQTLLCFDFGSGELFTGGNLFPSSSSGGVDSYTLAIPNLPQLAGVLAFTQALQFGHPPFVLSNAQDLTVGAF